VSTSYWQTKAVVAPGVGGGGLMAPEAGKVSDDTLLDLVNSRCRHAEDHYRSHFAKFARWYDLYRGFQNGRSQNFRNNIHLPFLFSVAQSDVARKVQTSFGGWPIVTFSGYAPEDAAIARKNEVLISSQMKDCNSFVKAVDFFLTANLYGTAVARVGWKKVVRKEQWRTMDPNEPGREVVVEGEATRFDGPDWSVVDPLDFVLQPGKRRIEDAAWCAQRYYLDLDQVYDKVQAGEWDRAAFLKLKESPVSGTAEGEMNQRMSVYRNWNEYQALKQEKFAKPVEIREYWGTVPYDMAPDGMANRVIVVANGRVVLSNQPNPFFHGKLPFLAFSPMPDPHYFHGVGKCEVGEKMQVTANRFANQKLDALDLFIDPVFLVQRQAGIDTTNLFMRAGRVIGVDGPVDESVIRPLIPDLSGLQQSYAEIQQLWGWIQQGTGNSENETMGTGAGSRSTAREYLGRQEAALTRLMLEARLAEEGFVEPLADLFRALDRQYLTLPHEVQILGSASVINPVTGLPMPQEPVVIDLSDLHPEYRARAVGATQQLGKGVRQQNLISVMQAMSANPVMLQSVNWSNFARQIFNAFDMPNIDELLVVGQVPAVNQVGANPQSSGLGAAQSGPAGPAPTTEPLSPELIGAMQGGQAQNPTAPLMGP